MQLEPDLIYTRDGRIWTSSGITAGIDLALALALALIVDDHGETVAWDTARQLVVHHRRSGGQLQVSALLELKTPSGSFATLVSWMCENFDTLLTVETSRSALI